MKERWALCALGAWLMGSAIMIMVATRNFRLIDHLLQTSPNAEFLAYVERWGAAPTRDLMRYLSSELNREYFQTWNIAQLALAAPSLLLIPRRPKARAWNVIAAATAIVIAMLLTLTPSITQIGRNLDFLPREPPPPALKTFWRLHIIYTVLELAKLLLVALAALWIAKPTPPAPEPASTR